MSQLLRALVALLFLPALPAQAERNLVRPPGTTRYAPMVARLKALLAYDQTQGMHRMALSSIGQSVKGRNIWMVTLQDSTPIPQTLAPTQDAQPDATGPSPVPTGDGVANPGWGPPTAKKLLYLCRQHGHEPASTEGALAFMDKLVHAPPDSPLAQDLQHVTVYVIPMANPDGAEAFLRHNAHDVDLNRDWLRQTQPETRAWLRAIQAIHPDLMTDQHELYPDDHRADFTETAGAGSGAAPSLVETCVMTQAVVQDAMQAEGFPTVAHRINDRHPARLAHRYGCVTLRIPTILFETNRLIGMHRSVTARAAAHEQFMTDTLRDLAGEQDQLEAEASAWQIAHVRSAVTVASRKKSYQRNPVPPLTPPELGAGGRTSEPEKTSE